VIPVRNGALPAGASEAFAEAGGRGVLVGTGTVAAAAELRGPGHVACAEIGAYAPGAWSMVLGPLLRSDRILILPASADGRDLAPRLAHVLGRPLLAGAVRVTEDEVVVARHDWTVAETHRIHGPVIATLLPGVRGDEDLDGHPTGTAVAMVAGGGSGAPDHDATVVAVLAGDPATMDLTEARRVLAGGAGLGDPSRFTLLASVAAALGASPGATRVVADAGWVPHHRYIGTTGVTVTPDLYIAVGISGAVQHVTGIRHPLHVIAVNVDPSAPMMALADLAVVCDGPGLLEALAARLGIETAGTAASVS
jgi:electron transfer flavoprotein alpha subunit